MDSFHALSDPTRRLIVELLASHGQLPVGSISQRFAMSPPAISQHLKILRDCEIIQLEKRGQQRLYSVNPSGIAEMERWLERVKQFWHQKLDDLEIYLRIEAQSHTSHLKEEDYDEES